MTIKELKKMIENLPDEMVVKCYNHSSEWYGEDEITPEWWEVIDETLVLTFDCGWDDYLRKEYKAGR